MSTANFKEQEKTDDTDLYSCRYSSLTCAITIDIYQDDTYNAIKSFLEKSYDLHLNKNGNGVETQIYEGDKKCVVTLYHNRTFFLQGKGSTEWKSKVFDPFMSSLNTSTTNDQSESLSSQGHPSFFDGSSASMLHSTPQGEVTDIIKCSQSQYITIPYLASFPENPISKAEQPCIACAQLS